MGFSILTASLLIGLYISRSTSRICVFNERNRFLNCSDQGLTYVPIAEFPVQALGIDLSFNRISEIKNQTFSNVSALQTLDLSNNVIDTLERQAFHELRRLISLNLSSNTFSLNEDVLNAELFEPLGNLKVIRIQNYRGSGYRKDIDSAFAQLGNLTTLYMDLPREFMFGAGFGALTNLNIISTQSASPSSPNHCDMRALRNKTFQVFGNLSVRVLRLIQCNIVSIENGVFEPLHSLEVLDLTYNFKLGLQAALGSLYGLIHRAHMEEIKLVLMNNFTSPSSGNFMLGDEDFRYLTRICVKSVDLSQNFISIMDSSNAFKTSCLEKLNLSFHSFRTIPVKVLHSLNKAESLTTVDLSHGYSAPASQGYHVPNLHSTDFLAPINLPANLRVLNVSSFGFWFYINTNFTFKNGKNLQSVEAAYINLDNCDGQAVLGLKNITHLDISGIMCKSIGAKYFNSFKEITSLSLSNSPNMDMVLLSVWQQPFALLHALEQLDLSGNKLVDLHPNLFNSNKRLRIIKMADNRLSALPDALFKIPDLLQLDLSSNDFTFFQAEEIKALDGWMTKRDGREKFQLALKGNPLQCTCETVVFIRWLLQMKQHLDEQGNYSCFLSDGSRTSVFKFGKHLTNFEVKCVSETYLTISVIGSLVFLLLFLLFACVYHYRLNLRYWLYTKLKPPEKMFSGDDSRYLYDAFVAYTSDDYAWVYGELRPKVEPHGGSIRLCFHDRDFVPGKPIHENIVDCIRQSRKTLLIISIGFISSRYGPLEIEYAVMKCLEEGRDDIILCVLMEDIPVRQMPRALRNLWHKITFLKWSSMPQEQAIFWRNLKNALCR